MKPRAPLLLLVAACGGSSPPAPAPIAHDGTPSAAAPSTTGPRCEEVVDHIMVLVREMPAAGRAEGIAECEGKPWSEALKRCALAADDPGDLVECAADAPAASDGRRWIEAEVNLHAIQKGAKAFLADTAAFPATSVPLTPAAECCTGDGGMCPANEAPWNQPAWDDLNFLLSDAHRFRYSYQSDGRSFVALAVGDLDCDGTTITYRLDGWIADGAPVFKLTQPTAVD